MFITTRIMNLKLNLAAFDVLRSPVHIQHGRLVLLRVRVVDVVVNQACFTDGCVSHENHFDLLWFIRFGFGRGLLLLLLNYRCRLDFSFCAAWSRSRISLRAVHSLYCFAWYLMLSLMICVCEGICGFSCLRTVWYLLIIFALFFWSF